MIEAQHKLRAKRYDNYDYIADKYSKYLDFRGEKDYASLKPDEASGSRRPLDYRAQITQALHQKRREKMHRNDAGDSEEASTDEEEGHGDKKKRDKMKRYKHTTAYVGKLLFLVSSILLLSVAALRFTVVDM